MILIVGYVVANVIPVGSLYLNLSRCSNSEPRPLCPVLLGHARHHRGVSRKRDRLFLPILFLHEQRKEGRRLGWRSHLREDLYLLCTRVCLPVLFRGGTGGRHRWDCHELERSRPTLCVHRQLSALNCFEL